ncbi:Adenylosuccinate synthetase [Lipomyces kononenkoae]|uniref:Adenylosuccinate synthetase n=1 Tax=Lipomyces kononenkoae TaxID=34357 RepID=A0ACC3T781_LIPKO
MSTVVIGAQWGDEGKGKLVDILCDQIDVCARCQGGNNAGHTIVVNGVTFDFHMLPSGLVNPNCVNLVGSGVVVHVPAFFNELEQIEKKGLSASGRLFVSSRCHLVFDVHQIADGLHEAELSAGAIGTTRRGIGPAYSTKATRSGIRVHHLVSQEPGAWEEFESHFRSLVVAFRKRYGEFEYDVEAEIERYKGLAEKLRPYVTDAVTFMHDALDNKKRILVEGANALMLDLDFGTYPFVTSSNTSIGGVCTGLGVPPQKITDVIGVVKAYTTRVGAGPFPTEQLNAIGETLQTVGAEYGVTTGRKRRCGWLDLVVVKYSARINGFTSMNITKLDVLDSLDEIKVGVAYIHNGKRLTSFPEDLRVVEAVEVEYVTFKGWKTSIADIKSYDDLPEATKVYLKFIESYVGTKISWIGVGPARSAMIQC